MVTVQQGLREDGVQVAMAKGWSLARTAAPQHVL
jgi:hypothetical protein